MLNTLIELNTEISAEKITAICKNMPTSEEVCVVMRKLMIVPASVIGRLFWGSRCLRRS